MDESGKNTRTRRIASTKRVKTNWQVQFARLRGMVVAVGEGDFASVVAAARAGDESALAALYRAHQPALVRFLEGLVPGEGEDLAAETWIDLARGLSRFEGAESEFRRFLYTIARRRAIDHGRKRRRRRTFASQTSVLAAREEGPDVAEVVSELDTSARAVRHVASILPKAQAEIVLLRVVGGLSVSEVAAVLGLTPAAVSVHQTRALRRLASKLGDPARWERQSEYG